MLLLFLHVSNNQQCWTSFHAPPDHVLPCKNVYSSLLPIFIGFFMLISMNCLHILDINPLVVLSFASIFCNSVGRVFFLSVVSFAVQKLLRSKLPFTYFCFYFFCLRRLIQENIAVIYVKEYSAYVSFRSFMIFALTFKSFKPFWVYFYIWYDGMF